MLREQIIAQALNRISEKRLHARQEQEHHTEEILRKIPEAVTWERQLRTVCSSLLQITDDEKRAERLEQIKKQTEDANTMMQRILTANGYPADYLDTHYSCEKCGDSGFVEGNRCECLKHEIAAISAEQINSRSRLALSSFDSFSLQYYEDLPSSQYHEMEQIYKVCREYASGFSPGISGNLFMFGGTGLGKTHLSLAIASEVLQKGFSVIYDSVSDLFYLLKKELFGRDNSNSELYESVLDCDLLILDDIGTEYDTEYSCSLLYSILNSRLNAAKSFVLNTNLSHDELLDRYSDRIVSRMVSSEVLHFRGKDIRLQKR